jgi:phage terminase small subunit
MAGVKGRSGGARPGAGRKPKSKVEVVAPADVVAKVEAAPNGDMLSFLQNVALGRINANATQVRAAIAAVQYTHTRTRDGGKKEDAHDAAKKAGASRFAPAAPPLKLVRQA